MHARPPANVVETIDRRMTRRACPGCGAGLDLAEYGVLTSATTIVCRACGRTSTVSDLVRV